MVFFFLKRKKYVNTLFIICRFTIIIEIITTFGHIIVFLFSKYSKESLIEPESLRGIRAKMRVITIATVPILIEVWYL